MDNTQAKTATRRIMQEWILATIKHPNIPQHMPSNISREVTGAIVNGETEALLEYQHLSKRPKYKEM